MIDSFCYKGTLPSSMGVAYRRLVNPADPSQVASVERDGSFSWVSGDGAFEAFFLPNGDGAASQIAAVNSANPGETPNWRVFAVVDVSKPVVG